MVRTRRVYVVTSNPERVPEFQKLLQHYGIEVLGASPYGYRTKKHGPKALLPLVTKLLSQSTESFWTKSVMYESVLLLCHGSSQHADAPGREFVDGEQVTVRATLTVWCHKAVKKDGTSSGLCDPEVEQFVYRYEMDAKIDLSKRHASQPNVFNWDDVVVDPYSGLSYHEKKQLGFKVSPRDMMLSQYLQDHVHYRTRRVCRYNPLEANRAVEFGDGSLVSRFFKKNEHLFALFPDQHGLCNVFTSVLNSGIFLRAAITRREFIYWLPGLNAGVPLVPKDDAIHEATFQAHDLTHFLLPDLLFTGEHTSLNRRLYIIYRMLSEAITLVFADMLFVEALRRGGLQYDWTKRKIWPLFRDCGLDPFPETAEPQRTLSVFRTLLEANVAYCLLGDDTKYRELMSNHLGTPVAEVPPALQDFKDKYMPFFVEDFRWTSQNYACMAEKASEMSRWWQLAAPLRRILGQEEAGPGASGLQTIAEFADKVHATETTDGHSLVWAAFEEVFRSRVTPVLLDSMHLEIDQAKMLFTAFGRYMMGQSILLARFSFLPESHQCHAEILRVMQAAKDAGGRLEQEAMMSLRQNFESYVDLLVTRQLISADDALTFKEVCPLFDPCFASYDEPLSQYEQLQRVSQEILGDSGADTSKHACEFHELRSKCASESQGLDKKVEVDKVKKSEPLTRGGRSPHAQKNGKKLRWVPKQK